MKSQITKIVSLLVCVCLIVSGMILSTSAAGTTVTYTSNSYTNPSSTGVKNATKTFTDGIITFGAYEGGSSGSVAFRSDEIRVYQGAYATMTSTKDITSVTFSIKGKDTTTVNISTSADGSSWNVVRSAASLTTSFANVTVDFDPATKHIKLSGASKQIIIKSITVTYAAEGGNTGDGDDNTGAGGTTPTPTPTPTPTDPADGSTLTIPEALALAESKDANVYTTNKYYVEGEIKNVYNTQYGNMYIKDANGNELCIYGTYSADGSISYNAMTTKPVAGDTIKVYGVIGKYVKSDGSVTTLQMKNGWIITHTPATPSNPGGTTPPPASSDPAADSTLTIAQALEVGGAKDHDNYTSGKYYVEGVISSVSNETYGNMTIKDANNNSLTIYGSYDADGTNRYDAMATKPVAGDTVKLYGIIGKYNSTVQMKNAWIVAHTPGTPPVNNDPAADTVLTVKAAAELGASKDHNAYTTGKYYVTGTIKSIASNDYGNMTIEDADGNELYVYGTWNEDGSVRYDALTEKPAVGDTVTVYGIIGQYNGTAQMKNGWFKAAPAGDDNQGGNTNTGAGTNTGANTNTNTNTNTGSTTTTTPAPEKSPETGDSIALYIVMMAISAAAMVLVAKKRFA